MQANKPNSKLEKILENLVPNMDLNKTIFLDEIKKAWSGMGKTLYEQAQPVSFKDGVLNILVKEFLWQKQLIKLTTDIKLQFNRYFGKEVVKEIKFVLQNEDKKNRYSHRRSN
ncbi:DUF721 domain-containing protein [Candidatus Poribacteria bacterium]|nr:DUF721 domain-containing protein [Candidatus Poribacteria bacterium]